MIEEFVELVYELFPSIHPYTRDRVKVGLEQFRRDRSWVDCFMPTPIGDYLAQGDIIEHLPFVRYDSQGNQSVVRAPGIMLTNTCGAENGTTVTFAPLFRISSLGMDRDAIVRNEIHRLLYFPDPILSDFVVDFGLINSYSKDLINFGTSAGTLTKRASLNRFGYYLFLCKLTVHFMRPEDTEVQNQRAV